MLVQVVIPKLLKNLLDVKFLFFGYLHGGGFICFPGYLKKRNPWKQT